MVVHWHVVKKGDIQDVANKGKSAVSVSLAQLFRDPSETMQMCDYPCLWLAENVDHASRVGGWTPLTSRTTRLFGDACPTFKTARGKCVDSGKR